MNLRTKFRLASSCLILTVVAGMMISLAVYEKKRLLADIDREQHQDLDKLARVCEDAMLVSDETALFKYVQNLVNLSSPRVSYAGVVFETRSIGDHWIYSNLQDPPFSYISGDSEDIKAITKTRKILRRETTFQNKPIIELSKPVGRIGYVRLGYSRDVVTTLYLQTIHKSFERFAVVGFLAIILGLLLAHIFSAALTRSIGHLMTAAEAIARGQKGVKVPEGTGDEIGRLTRTFNHMSEELAKLDKLKDDFMSHVTHELRSPLTSIIATVELMAEMPFSENPKFKRSIDRLIYGSERLNHLVDNILDLTRMEAGKMTFDIQPVDIGKIASEMADFFEPRALEKELKIRAAVPADSPMVMADPERIRQVLSNLVHNAIKFTNKGSIVIWVREKDGVAQVGVQDTGVGIPQDQLNEVFKKFECLKDTRDRVDRPMPGSGLGLNIVLNSIKAQGGKIWVESEVGKGSVFVFTLPLVVKDAKDSAEPPKSNGSDASPRPSSSTRGGKPRSPVILSPEKKLP